MREQWEGGGASIARWTADAGDGQRHRLRWAYRDYAIDCTVSPDGADVTVTWTEALPYEHVPPLLCGPVLGRALRLRGVPCLHASAVEVDGRALAVVGPSGAGKSTLAGALAGQGHRLLCDDFAAVARAGTSVLVHPGQARLRLWPDAAERLGAPGEPVFDRVPEWTKRVVPAGPPAPPLPLAAVYELHGRAAELEIEPLAPTDRLAALTRNVYGELPLPAPLRAAEFAVMGEVARTVPVLSLRLPDDLSRVDGAARALAEDARAR